MLKINFECFVPLRPLYVSDNSLLTHRDLTRLSLFVVRFGFTLLGRVRAKPISQKNVQKYLQINNLYTTKLP